MTKLAESETKGKRQTIEAHTDFILNSVHKLTHAPGDKSEDRKEFEGKLLRESVNLVIDILSKFSIHPVSGFVRTLLALCSESMAKDEMSEDWLGTLLEYLICLIEVGETPPVSEEEETKGIPLKAEPWVTRSKAKTGK